MIMLKMHAECPQYFISWTRKPQYIDTRSDMPPPALRSGVSPPAMRSGMPPPPTRSHMPPPPTRSRMLPTSTGSTARFDMSPPARRSKFVPMATPLADAFLKEYQESIGYNEADTVRITGSIRNPVPFPNGLAAPTIQSNASYLCDIEEHEPEVARQTAPGAPISNTNQSNLYRSAMSRAPSQGLYQSQPGRHPQTAHQTFGYNPSQIMAPNINPSSTHRDKRARLTPAAGQGAPSTTEFVSGRSRSLLSSDGVSRQHQSFTTARQPEVEMPRYASSPNIPNPAGDRVRHRIPIIPKLVLSDSTTEPGKKISNDGLSMPMYRQSHPELRTDIDFRPTPLDTPALPMGSRDEYLWQRFEHCTW